MTQEQVEAAATEFRNRRDGHAFPKGAAPESPTDGWWMPWYPWSCERRSCCDVLKTPSPTRDFTKRGFSQYNHCLTYKHIAALFDVPLDQLKLAVKQLDGLEGPRISMRPKDVRAREEDAAEEAAWVQFGFDPGERERWLKDRSWNARDAKLWRDAGFGPEETRRIRAAGIKLKIAAAERAAGVSTDDIIARHAKEAA